MSSTGARTISLTSLVLCAFAANSLLCRGALAGERIDATRGAIEALRSSLERQDFRSDDLGRRLTRLETLWSTSPVAERLARQAVGSMPRWPTISALRLR